MFMPPFLSPIIFPKPLSKDGIRELIELEKEYERLASLALVFIIITGLLIIGIFGYMFYTEMMRI